MKICTPWPRSDTSRIWKSEVLRSNRDRKSTRLNSSHSQISYAVFCLKKKRINHRNVQFMYRDGTHYHFIDTTTYDQLSLDEEMLGDSVNYLTDGMTGLLSEYEGSSIGVELPASVVLKVTDTDLGLKGDTATGATKPATVETGLRVNVPLFVECADKIKVDTRTGEYLERA